MSELKNRKIRPNNASTHTEQNIEEDNNKTYEEFYLEIIFKVLKIIVGLFLMLIISYYYSRYLKLLHENNLWFSHIKVTSVVNLKNISLFSVYV